MYHLHTKKQKAHFEEVVRLHQPGCSPARISRIIGISSSTVREWLAIFATYQSSQRRMKKVNPPTPSSASSTEASVANLQAENARLRAELLDARLRADLLDEIINVAEAQFKLPIRKKAGAKQ